MANTTTRLPLEDALCPPEKRMKDVTREQIEDAIRRLERNAHDAMAQLSCGSDNWEYRIANENADANWFGASALRLMLAQMTANRVGENSKEANPAAS